jgi:hypothetical protein
MTAADLMGVVIFAFFLVGVMVGIVVVYALSARKADRAYHGNRSEEVRDASRRGKSSLPV